jgi:hypothetical protein
MTACKVLARQSEEAQRLHETAINQERKHTLRRALLQWEIEENYEENIRMGRYKGGYSKGRELQTGAV